MGFVNKQTIRSVEMNIDFLKDKKIMISAVAIVLVGAITMPLVLTPQDETGGARERAYTAKKDNITVGIETSGQIDTLPNRHSFEENTVVDEVFTKLGSEVRKGDKLASISTENLGELMEGARNQLSDAKISLLQASSSKDVMLGQNNKNKQDGLDTIHQQFDTKIERLGKDKEKIQKTIETNETKVIELEQKILEISPQVKEYEDQIKVLKDEINENILKIGELNEEILQVDTASEERKKET